MAEYAEGDRVEVKTLIARRFGGETVWVPGVVTGTRCGTGDEDFRRVDVRADAGWAHWQGCHPDCVRPVE